MRGKLIALEGLDRSGKTTQAKLLADSLKNSFYIRFPERTSPLGKIIDSYLKKHSQDINDRVIHILFSGNRWEFHPIIEEKLKQNQTVILDRYFSSGIAYSAAKGLEFEWCRSFDKGLFLPDLTFFLDIDGRLQSQREGFGKEIYETSEFQKKVKEQYTRLFDDSWCIINANQSVESITQQIQKKIEKTEISEEIKYFK